VTGSATGYRLVLARGHPGRCLRRTWEEEQVSTRNIAIAALIIAVVLLLIFLL
jgi:hypothetical protein